MAGGGLVRRLAITAGFGLAVGGPLAAAVAAAPDVTVHRASCAGGEEADPYTTSCVPFLVPNSPAPGGHGSVAPASDVVACPSGVTGDICAGSGNAQPQDAQASKGQTSSAEQAAAQTETIGQDVAGMGGF